MKRLISIIFIVLFACSLSGCRDDDAGIIDIFTPQPALTGAPTDMATAAPTAVPTEYVTDIPTEVPTEAPTEIPTEVPTEAPTEPDFTVFDDAAFIGNSVFNGLYMFGIIKHGSFFTKTSLNVSTVFTVSTDDGTVPIIDELNEGTYNKVILFFGANELGWPSYDTFINKYSALLDGVWERQPNAKIFICAVLPTNKAKDDKNENGINNANIIRMNERILQLCQERGAYFIEAPAAMFDKDGRLPDEASSDGIHLNTKYYHIWADHICLSVMAES